MQSLADALAALDAGERERALDLLLDAWRTTNAPAIADAIDVLSRELTLHEPPIRPVGNQSARKLWHQRAAERRPAGLGRLLEVLPDGNDRDLRLGALLEMDRDPRFATAAQAWLASPPVSGSKRVPFFTVVVELLAKTRDVRILPELRQMASARSSTIHRIGLRTWKPFNALVGALEKVQPEALSQAASDTLEEIVALLSAPKPIGIDVDPAGLFAKVYADPDDDEARAVLGDLLQQRGDPRGEFIALQLTRAGTDKRVTARERELEDTWGRTWLGALEPSIHKGGVVFERGFLARCRLASGGRRIAELEEWSTVTHLDVTTASRWSADCHALLTSRVARSLRHVVGVGIHDLREVAKTELPWETLGLILWRWSDTTDLLERLPAAFPRVTTLIIRPVFTEGIEGMPPSVVRELVGGWKKLERVEWSADGQITFDLAPKTGALAIVARWFDDTQLERLRLTLRELGVARAELETGGKPTTIEAL